MKAEMTIDEAAVARAQRKLRLASWIQFAGSILPSLVLVAYLSQPEEAGRMPGWLCAPIALGTSFPLRRHRAWAFYLSIFLTPFYPLAPYLDLMHIRGSLHGGEVVFALAVPVGLFFSVLLFVLLVQGRHAVTNTA